MKKSIYILVSLTLLFFIVGCGEDEEDTYDHTTQSFTIINSVSSTFRIIQAEANLADKTLDPLSISGDGIHKGGSQSFNVYSDECDENWRVSVHYNDPDHTNCAATKFVACDASTSFIFNNTDCVGAN